MFGFGSALGPSSQVSIFSILKFSIPFARLVVNWSFAARGEEVMEVKSFLVVRTVLH